ncbi:MAG: hypothetical protein A2234_04755 [Elusimicrobia bacterium RIFOXYA2_FULL_58_8]|nr:MAG: hypothetical protein A2285_05470 [Elusimicrobia bacterium RIFOXYA12_FULL_57_11]OGS13616.1 MAG: hypothetical protein A2234_04755 [Elusimicrobia bacterium RIFOXYA2_FULL_58_8]
MSGTDDLKTLLDRLKDEVGQMPVARTPLPAAPQQAPERPAAYRPQPERFARPGANGARGEDSPHLSSQDLSWRENKEIILFGMLSSLIGALGGVLAGFEYVILTCTVLFSLFSLMLLFMLLGHHFGFMRRDAASASLAERVDVLSRKIEALSLKGPSSAGTGHLAGETGREFELERKVEELRVLFKSLSKALEQRK